MARATFTSTVPGGQRSKSRATFSGRRTLRADARHQVGARRASPGRSRARRASRRAPRRRTEAVVAAGCISATVRSTIVLDRLVVARARALDGATSALDVAASTKTPRPVSSREREERRERVEAQVRDSPSRRRTRRGERSAQPRLGVALVGRAEVAALGVGDDQDVARRARRRSAARGPGNPAEPNRSKKATCGLIAAADADDRLEDARARRTPARRRCRCGPRTRADRGSGSTPTHSGPSARMRSCSRTTERLSHGPLLSVRSTRATSWRRHPRSRPRCDAPRRARVGECRGAHLDGVGPRHQHRDRVLAAARRPRRRRSASSGTPRGTRRPRAATRAGCPVRSRRRPRCRATVDAVSTSIDEAEHGVHEHQRVAPASSAAPAISTRSGVFGTQLHPERKLAPPRDASTTPRVASAECAKIAERPSRFGQLALTSSATTSAPRMAAAASANSVDGAAPDRADDRRPARSQGRQVVARATPRRRDRRGPPR